MYKNFETSLGNKEIFSRNLRKYMELSGVTQRELARLAGVSTGTFNDWVKGRIYPRMDKIQFLADYFGISKSDLIEDVNSTDNALSIEDQEILDLFHKVSDDKKAFVLSVIRSAIDNL